MTSTWPPSLPFLLFLLLPAVFPQPRNSIHRSAFYLSQTSTHLPSTRVAPPPRTASPPSSTLPYTLHPTPLTHEHVHCSPSSTIPLVPQNPATLPRRPVAPLPRESPATAGQPTAGSQEWRRRQRRRPFKRRPYWRANIPGVGAGAGNPARYFTGTSFSVFNYRILRIKTNVFVREQTAAGAPCISGESPSCRAGGRGRREPLM